jgi:hypothetical protein
VRDFSEARGNECPLTPARTLAEPHSNAASAESLRDALAWASRRMTEPDIEEARRQFLARMLSHCDQAQLLDTRCNRTCAFGLFYD